MVEQHRQAIDKIAEILQGCHSVLFITGAGISADSGMPTYRGIGGLYDVDMTEEGVPIEEVLSGEMLYTNPELTWKYLGHIAEAVRGATFNRAHEVIAAIERDLPRVWTLTQNVDGFHRLAGSHNVIEIHGNMHSLSCLDCDYHVADKDIVELEGRPRCPSCSAWLRPDVVLFGEPLPEEAINQLHRELTIGFEVVVSVGTSSLFPYIQEPLLAARSLGVPTVEINPGETVLSKYVEYRLPLRAATALDEIWKSLERLR